MLCFIDDASIFVASVCWAHVVPCALPRHMLPSINYHNMNMICNGMECARENEHTHTHVESLGGSWSCWWLEVDIFREYNMFACLVAGVFTYSKAFKDNLLWHEPPRFVIWWKHSNSDPQHGPWRITLQCDERPGVKITESQGLTNWAMGGS